MHLTKYLLPFAALATAAQACVRLKAQYYYAKPDEGRKIMEATIWDNGNKVCELKTNADYLDPDLSPDYRHIFDCVSGYAASSKPNLSDIAMYISRDWGEEKMPLFTPRWEIVAPTGLPLYALGYASIWGCECTHNGCDGTDP